MRTAKKAAPKKLETKAPLNLTPNEQAIAERVAGEDTDWFTIGEESMTDFSLMTNVLDLRAHYPEAATLQEEKVYAFRWIERTPERVDQMTRSAHPPMRWAIVNKTTCPELEKYVDPLIGGIVNLDQILIFKPWAHHMRVKAALEQMADAKAGAPLNKLSGVKDVDVDEGEHNKIQGNDIVDYDEERDRKDKFANMGHGVQEDSTVESILA